MCTLISKAVWFIMIYELRKVTVILAAVQSLEGLVEYVENGTIHGPLYCLYCFSLPSYTQTCNNHKHAFDLRLEYTLKESASPSTLRITVSSRNPQQLTRFC